MKYILIFLISFLIFSPAYAAKTVQGSIPKVEPLHPLPSGVAPDFSHSIESSSSDLNAGEENFQPAGQAAQQNQTQNNSSSPDSASQSRKPNFLILLIIIVIGGMALGWVWLRTKKV